MAPQKLTIGALSKRSNCKVPTIRYYEQIGLMPEPARSEGNQRIYQERHLERLTFIRHSRELGFSVDDIRDLLRLSEHPEQPCEQADLIARRHRAAVRARIRQLRILDRELDRVIEECPSEGVGACRVIELLSDHSRCLADDHSGADERQDKQRP